MDIDLEHVSVYLYSSLFPCFFHHHEIWMRWFLTISFSYIYVQVPNQIGTAILSTTDGKILKATGALDNDDDGAAACSAIYKMLLDSSKCLQNEPMRRMSISYTDYNYIITLGQGHVYIVKTDIVN